MSSWKKSVFVAGVVGAVCVMATAQPVVEGDRLTTREGLTLYTFDNDVPGSGKSVCNAPCSGIFPPYLVEAGAAPGGPHSVIARDDGTKQWAYKGRPLYKFFNDQKRGDKIGDGMSRNTWHVAKP